MGPSTSQWFGDFGADVIKVEGPGGDTTRVTGPAIEPGMATTFLAVNRNKRSIVLDLKSPKDLEALLRLVDTADVFMHNIRPQKLKALGIDAESLTKRNPRLVYATLTGYGEGPYRGKPAYDDIIQGASGCVDLMRRQSGESRYFPTIIADKVVGLVAGIAICAALTGRAATGKGCAIDIPMFETMAAFNLQEHFYGLRYSPPTSPPGYPRVLSPYRRPQPTRDGEIALMPYTNAHWQAFFAEAGRPDLAASADFATLADRTRNIGKLYETVGQLTVQKTTSEWTEICERRDIPYGPINSIEDLIEDPHLNATGFFAWKEDRMGKVCFTQNPVTFDGEPNAVHFPPRLGEHTAEILEELGIG
jgi:crotonobetainyl-CoA:carnitine CoA-transferase CaiB-like acyl-CoA transferase